MGTVAVGSPQTLLILATVTSPSPQTNTATITHADQFDPNPGNNTASVAETPQQADLALSKSVNDPTPNVGDTITYTVTLSNNGPDAATSVQVTDPLPGGVSFVSDTTSQGTYDAEYGRVERGDRQYWAAADAGDSGDGHEPRPADQHGDDHGIGSVRPRDHNNTASVVETPQQADLALAKSVSNPTPNVGDTISYTITLTDSGPDAATDAQVTDLLPAGVSFVSDTPSQGTYDAGTGLWSRRDGHCRVAADAGDPGDGHRAPTRRPTRRRSATPTSSTP